MKINLRYGAFVKLSALLAESKDPELRSLSDYLKRKQAIEGRMLMADELESILLIIGVGLDIIKAQGGSVRTGIDYRRTVAALPKLRAMLRLQQLRESDSNPENDQG